MASEIFQRWRRNEKAHSSDMTIFPSSTARSLTVLPPGLLGLVPQIWTAHNPLCLRGIAHHLFARRRFPRCYVLILTAGLSNEPEHSHQPTHHLRARSAAEYEASHSVRTHTTPLLSSQKPLGDKVHIHIYTNRGIDILVMSILRVVPSGSRARHKHHSSQSLSQSLKPQATPFHCPPCMLGPEPRNRCLCSRPRLRVE